jgi:hypothetical protein
MSSEPPADDAEPARKKQCIPEPLTAQLKGVTRSVPSRFVTGHSVKVIVADQVAPWRSVWTKFFPPIGKPCGVYVKRVPWQPWIKEWKHFPLESDNIDPEPRYVVVEMPALPPSNDAHCVLLDVNKEPSRPVTRYRKQGNTQEASPSPVTRVKDGRRYALHRFAVDPPYVFVDEHQIYSVLHQTSLYAPTLSIEAPRLSIFCMFSYPSEELVMDTFNFDWFTWLLSAEALDIPRIRDMATPELIVMLTLCCIADQNKSRALFMRMFGALARALDQYSIPLETCQHSPHPGPAKEKTGRYDWTHAVTCLGIDLLSCVPSSNFVEDRSLVGGLWLPGAGIVNAKRTNAERVQLLMRDKLFRSESRWEMVMDIRRRIGSLHIAMRPASEHVCVAEYPSIKNLLQLTHPKDADRLLISYFVSGFVPETDRPQFLLGLPISAKHRMEIAASIKSIDKHTARLSIRTISDRAGLRMFNPT